MRGFIITTIFLLAIAGLGYQGFKTFAKSPNVFTQQAASTIVKYPNAQDWQLKNQKNVCFFATDECLQPTKVSFHSDDVWNQIYFFYREQMVQNGWNTKSTIITSIPTSIVFTNTTNCIAFLTQPKPLVNFGSKSSKNKYSFSVTCPNDILPARRGAGFPQASSDDVFSSASSPIIEGWDIRGFKNREQEKNRRRL